jgi:hypothetical protein
MAIFNVPNNDPRLPTFQKGFNLRWPEGNVPGAPSSNGADNIYFCETASDVFTAAGFALSAANARITVRSGGHCYEGFVSNKLASDTRQEHLSIIDISMLTGMQYDKDGKIAPEFPDTATSESTFTPSTERYKFKVSAGNQNWNNYTELYKKTGKTIPGGSCYSVGAGGHICGGGYGYLARKQGLTCDLLSGVDILVPEPIYGIGLQRVHVSRHQLPASGVPNTNKDYLFLACCGAGGGQFGIITAYYFDELPDAPKEVLWTVFDWQHKDVSKEHFDNFLNAFYLWFSANDDPKFNETWGLHTKLELRHQNTGPISLGIHFIDQNSGVSDLTVLEDFYTKVVAKMPEPTLSYSAFPAVHIPNAASPQGPRIKDLADFTKYMRRMDWLTFTQNVNGSGENQKGRYKSAYQKGGRTEFSASARDAIWNAINSADPNKYQTQSLIQLQSYGGQINNASAAIKNSSASGQRDSVIKWQPQTYWRDTQDMTSEQISALDQIHATWIRNLYKDAFRNTIQPDLSGVPVNDYFDGCYINYPDLDMTYINGNTDGLNNSNANWREIYFPHGKEALLRQAKKMWDPKNMFKNSMSVPVI